MQSRTILTALLAIGILAGLTPSADAQTPAEVQQALSDARKGNSDRICQLKESYGDKVLSSFAVARFDKHPAVRRATLDAAGNSLESLLFIIPIVEDEQPGIANTAIRRIISFRYYGRETFRALRAEQVIPPLVAAFKKHPVLFRNPPGGLLLLLSQYKNDPAARSLLGRLLKANGWSDFFVGNTPTKWDDDAVAALLAQCEMGRLSPAQVQTVFTSDPETRIMLLSYIDYVNNKSILRYALSLLYDTTRIKSGSSDIASPRVSAEAWDNFQSATKIDIKWREVNGEFVYEDGLPAYDKADIARLYAYYGLTGK